jgi:glycosyltransferase involved in cell wall biosynthesis
MIVKVNQIKLLIIIHSLEVGGAEGQVYELARGLNKNHYQPVVCALTSKGPYIEKLRAEGVRVEVICDRLRQLPWKLFKLVRLFRAEKFDVVQNIMFTAGVVGTVFAKVCGVPVVINSIRSLGFLHYWYRRPIKRFLYTISDCVVANSKQTRSLLIKHGIAQAARIRTIYNGVDTDRFQPRDNFADLAQAKAAFGLSDKGPVIGMIANLSPVKNHECLLKAIPRVLEALPRAAFLIVGGGSLRPHLEQIAASLGVHRSVFFWANERTQQNCCS